MIINIKEGVIYDTEKTIKEQSDKFQEYSNGMCQKIAQKMYPEYPKFDKDGNITYNFSDDKLDHFYKRIQLKPFSTSDRSVKKIVITIKVK